MWDRLRKQIGVEREQLKQLVDTHRPLLRKCSSLTPDPIERSALAAMLHSFYTGVENVFKRVAVEIDDDVPQGEAWHRELLGAMAYANRSRPAVISSTLHDRLTEYLGFRHVFRQAYSFQLRWEKMAHLVLETEKTLQQIETELDSFFECLESHETDDTDT